MYACRSLRGLRDLIKHLVSFPNLIKTLAKSVLRSRDTAVKLIRSLLYLLDSQIHLSGQILDLVGKLLDLHCHNRKALALLSGACSLDGSVDRKNIRLIGNGYDLIRTPFDPLYCLLQVFEGSLHLIEICRNLLGAVP